ncbi:MAG: haloacid dehalogenase-like hydrolase [Glaciimonas sp.]|nr:haloacid dehalogenase-like hydrolase [Glaciimonas sp.]
MMKTIACSAVLAVSLVSFNTAQAETALKHWPPETAAKLDAMIKAKAHKNNFAVFDADQTTYQYDLTEALLPFLEAKGVLTRASIPAFLKLIPFKDNEVGGKLEKESLYSYYQRLCAIDDQVCYPWVAQIFSGLTLRQLKGYVDELLVLGKENKEIPVQYYDGDKQMTAAVKAPKMYPGMQELYNELMRNGINVYVMSAASEELVRMVLADPKYGYNVKPQNVIGVSVLLKDRKTGDLTTARKLIAEKKYDPVKLMDYEYGHYLWAPLTWFEGKPAGIKTYIDQWKKPVLVAGDTPASDGPMLFELADVEKGGMRVWVNRKEQYWQTILQMQKENAAAQKQLGLPVTADKNWVMVRPMQIQ